MVNEYGSVGTYDAATGSITYEPGSAAADYADSNLPTGATFFIGDAYQDNTGQWHLPSYGDTTPSATAEKPADTGGGFYLWSGQWATSGDAYTDLAIRRDSVIYNYDGTRIKEVGYKGLPARLTGGIEMTDYQCTGTGAIIQPEQMTVQQAELTGTAATSQTESPFAGIAATVEDVRARIVAINPSYIIAGVVILFAVFLIFSKGRR